MLQKWKDIISNWINCYFNESEKSEERVTLESLINIISHLRENLSLDESKSSILEAHTVEEFLREKYPEFRFDNGSVEAASEDEILIVASLLLYFVCVNSKDLDIKHAMCSQLSGEDQEIILKFSKCLMECSPVTNKDVQSAIFDACGQDPTTTASSSSRLVSETPPALRSLHGEVRRLQAALDAERFDRNYLQEELARTNLRVEKLAKDKEQYKLEIVNLKAKISLCCGQENDARAGDAASDSTAKMVKQLEEMEERLVFTQGQLDDAQYERDAYKAKINELKRERDKWFTTSQQESALAAQLRSELEDERRRAASLGELVTELRQHHQRNLLDASHECDDHDVSLHSPGHNVSICSEACANVVEVQLSEERAKIVVLKQQIQSLQVQLNDLSQQSETEKQSLERILSVRENDIFNLKHRINEEIEEKNNLKTYYSDEMTKLNNEINELEQKLKDTNQQSRMVVESKMQEIQTLQEEKLSLLQSIADETNKLENVIKNLKSELETEKASKAKLREDYDNHIMKLNEKVLNRNNELVELQNDVFEKSDKIEALFLELRKEKRAREELIARHGDECDHMNEKLLENDSMIKLKSEEIARLTERLNYNFEFIKELGREVDDLKYAVSEQTESCRALEEAKRTMLEELQAKDNKLEELHKHLENIENVYSEEKDRLEKDMDEAVATVNSLRMQLQEELQFKIETEQKSAELQKDIEVLKQQLSEAQSLNNGLVENKKMLLADKESLTKQFTEEKLAKEQQLEVNNNLEERTKMLLEEKDLLTRQLTVVKEINEQQLAEYQSVNNDLTEKNQILVSEREMITQQLVEEKASMEHQLAEAQSVNIDLIEKNKILVSENVTITEQLSIVAQQLTEAHSVNKDLMEKNNILVSEKETITEQLSTVKQQLTEAHSVNMDLIEKNNILISEKETITEQLSIVAQQLTEAQSVYNSVTENNKQLLAEKEMMTQQLIEERETRTIVEEQKSMLAAEKTAVKEDLDVEVKVKNNLLEDRERLTQQLVEERSAKELAEKEKENLCSQLVEESKAKENLIQELYTVMQDDMSLRHQLKEATMEKQRLHNDYEILSQTLSEEKGAKDELVKENDELTIEVKTLRESLTEVKEQNSQLNNNFNFMNIEKESLLNSLQEIKMNNDVLEEEKNTLLITIDELKEQIDKQTVELKNKQEEYDSIKITFADVKTTKDKYEEANAQTTNTLLTGIDKLFNNLKTEDFNNEVLAKFIIVDNPEASLKDKCELIINIANTLTTELAVKKSLEVALQQKETEIADMRQLMSETEMQVLQLQTEVSKLQQTISESKIELSKQKESYVTSIDTRTRDIHTLQQENQYLTNELNDVKTQLEVKVHSLKEKLTDNENLTEKLKKTYDCQIDNLNVMVTKLTNYLKEKTMELDMLRKEKEKLQEAIEDSNKNIKSLEEELKAEKHNQNKLLGEFESERLVLKNMVTVTESVMEDQKTSLNNVITEHVKTNEILKEEINALNEKIQAEKNNYEIKLQEKETLFENAFKDLTDMKIKKETLQKECDVTRELLLTEIEALKKEVTSKVSQVEAFELQNKELSRTIEKCMRVIESLEDEVKVLKQNREEILHEFESEKLVLGNMVTETKAALEDEKINLNNIVTEHIKAIETWKEEYNVLEEEKLSERNNYEIKLQDKEISLEKALQQVNEITEQKKIVQEELEKKNEELLKEIEQLKEVLSSKVSQVEVLEVQNIELNTSIEKYKEDINNMKKDTDELKITMDSQQAEFTDKIETLTKEKDNQVQINKQLTNELQEKEQIHFETQNEIDTLTDQIKETNELKQEIIKKQQLNVEMQKKVDDITEKLNKLSGVNENLEQEKTYYMQKATKLNTELIAVVDAMKTEKETIQKELEMTKEQLVNENEALKNELSSKVSQVEILEQKNQALHSAIEKCMEDVNALRKETDELKIKMDSRETEFTNKLDAVKKENNNLIEINKQLKQEIDEKHQIKTEIQKNVDDLTSKLNELVTSMDKLLQEKTYYINNAEELKSQLNTVTDSLNKEITKLQNENAKLKINIEEYQTVIAELEKTIQKEREQTNELRLGSDNEKLNLNNKCSLLQEYQLKAEIQMEDQQKDIAVLQDEVKTLRTTAEIYEKDLKEKCDVIQEKDEQINNIIKDLNELKINKEKIQVELEYKIAELNELKQKLTNENVQKALRSEEWVKAIGQRDTFAVAVSDKTGSHKNSCNNEKEYREFHHQVDNTTSDLTHSSMESIKTISDLEKIIHDKNRTITTLQSDITYLKSLIADSENKLLDVTKELEVSKENCQQLSNQLKKIVHQKNEEIAELKKQVNKMTVTENRASQIIKVSAKYQAIILKRIAEIKSNTVLKELTNFGNSANGDNDLRRSLNAGTITMEDLENFLETTDKHLKRCSEKQLALQKERDRLTEVNRINESEIINLKKFLTELSVSFKTFSNVKDLYAQKFSRVVSVQRTVRREILSLDGHITDATMCKLERGYAAVMQDLSECVMNMERWVERCIGRTISPEKIKQAFSNDEDRQSMAPTTFQNAGLEVQLEELENSFQKLLEEVVRAQKGEGARDAQSVTVMEVRAEYEDKLNRMKAKMKQLYQEQISAYKEKQRLEVISLERELAKTRERLAESSKAYEEHIRSLTAELWSVGEKFLTKKDEVDWLRKRQRSGSLMSLQHVHSSGLVPPPEEPSRPSDTHSLRSLPVHNNPPTNKRDKEGRGLHMSDEEGEVFDNRWLKELASTPRRPSPPRDTGRRLSELRWRNSLCPPHLKSSYPAETQFQPVVDEEDIKFSLGNTSLLNARQQRKEVGITAYKKPGPPTPSKNAGRVSATDSELRESLRVEAEPQPSRKTSTPSRLRSLFRSNKNDTAEGTPRSKRLSIFRKK